MDSIIERLVPDDIGISAAIHPVLKRIYAARGVCSDAELDLRLAGLEPPHSLRNIEQATALLAAALARQARLLIVGDFDADGATSTALCLLCLRAMGYQQVDYLVPNRFEYGYGLTPEIVEVAKARQPDLIITVDNGIASHEGIVRAAELGIQVLVTDHHLPGASLPPAACILNPNLPDCGFPSKSLAGVGVVFYLMSALRACLRQQGWFQSQGLAVPNMAGFLDLVALGTVADVVPLDRNNRRLVRHGLDIIRGGRGRPGIRALLEAAKRNPDRACAADLGFAAGPRLNAAGRLDDMALGIECLLAEEPLAARRMAQQLDSLNLDRRSIEQDMQQQALRLLQDLKLDEAALPPGLCLYDPGWHQGVIGILASRLKDRFHRPAIVFADADGDASAAGLIKGSARSIPGLHMRDLLDAIATGYPGLLSKFGGHAMAAGLSLRRADFPAFQAALGEQLQRQLDPAVLQRQTLTDGRLDPDCFVLDFAEQLRDAGPWGQAFPEPLFEGEFPVEEGRLLGGKHLKLVLRVPHSAIRVDAIAFNVDAGDWQTMPRQIRCLYRLDVNEFRGTCSLQLMVERIETLD